MLKQKLDYEEDKGTESIEVTPDVTMLVHQIPVHFLRITYLHILSVAEETKIGAQG